MSYTVVVYTANSERYLGCREWETVSSRFTCTSYETIEQAAAAKDAAYEDGCDEVLVFAGEDVDV